MSDLSSKGVVNLVSDEVRQIYSLLEADFTPLELCQRLAPLLEKLGTVTEAMSGMDPLAHAILSGTVFGISGTAAAVGEVCFLGNVLVHVQQRCGLRHKGDTFGSVHSDWHLRG